MSSDFECRLSLLDGAGEVAYSQVVPLVTGYPTSLWPGDAVVSGRYVLTLDRNLPVGQYTVELAIAQAPLGEPVGKFVLGDPVRVVAPARSFAIPQMGKRVGAEFAGQVRLIGYDLHRAESELVVTLHWQALSMMGMDYKVFLHMFDPGTEKIAAQQDVLIGGEAHPTTRWVPDEVVSTLIVLPLESVTAGTYRLAVGLYDPGGRLAVTAPSELTVSADRLLLNEVIIQP